jgi:hypothetical protein
MLPLGEYLGGSGQCALEDELAHCPLKELSGALQQVLRRWRGTNVQAFGAVLAGGHDGSSSTERYYSSGRTLSVQDVLIGGWLMPSRLPER